MTLSEIETILEELSTRHANLDSNLLSTILLSSGWEQRNIQDALVIFKQKEGTKSKTQAVDQNKTTIISPVPVLPPTPVVNKSEIKKEESVVSGSSPLVTSTESMTFLLPDGSEEGELHHHEEVTLPPKQEKKESIVLPPVAPVVVTPPSVEVIVPLEDISVKKEPVHEVALVTEKKEVPLSHSAPQEAVRTPVHPTVELVSGGVDVQKVPSISLSSLPQLTAHPVQESLVVHKESDGPKAPPKPNHIPADLPLIPFESSPHIWSFARYKDVFHRDDIQEEKKPVLQTSSAEPKVVPQKTPELVKENSPSLPNEEEIEEIIVEKTPMGKEDESLVFLAGIMLLAIILILGYMYSNGRL